MRRAAVALVAMALVGTLTSSAGTQIDNVDSARIGGTECHANTCITWPPGP